MATSTPTPPRRGGERTSAPRSQIGPVSHAIAIIRATHADAAHSPQSVASGELRALFVYDAVPPGCIVHPVTEDDLAPHLRPAEFAIVDTTDRDPIHGELFLVAWMGNPDADGRERRALVQARLQAVSDISGAAYEQPLWSVGSIRRHRSRDEIDRLLRERRYDELGWTNGPYRPGMLEQQIRGRVVGVLASLVEEPKRLPLAKGGRA